ncbi:metallophosphoesterase family protein [Microbacterium sp. SS28]|uniref:metallophosphoesterase family protein n=1 Tax=Microbacterium sp. SS28 TaxID=2919948 RepID=UPI001FAB074D|nr:metallophosphoesterase [Microbacterium sp. SS28]
MKHGSASVLVLIVVLTGCTVPARDDRGTTSTISPTAENSAAPLDLTRAETSFDPTTVAVIGDVPYGVDQEESLNLLVDAINDDPEVQLTIHLGDIKDGNTECSDERFAAALTTFESFDEPLVYTPGDNEWADCHHARGGGYNPLERLTAVRDTFFADPGFLLGGQRAIVDYQADVVENVRWFASRVVFATLHVVGSNNGLDPWTGLEHTVPTEDQIDEVAARIAAACTWVDETFDSAEQHDLDGVVLAMHADTWAPLPSSAEQPIVDRITDRATAFNGMVLILQGDSHEYVVDRPLDNVSVTRVVVHGESLPFEYLRLTINPTRRLFTWERVPVTG